MGANDDRLRHFCSGFPMLRQDTVGGGGDERCDHLVFAQYATSREHLVVLTRFRITMDGEAGGVRIRIPVGVTDDGEQAEIDVTRLEDDFLARSLCCLPKGEGALTDDVEEGGNDAGWRASQNTRLRRTVDEELVYQPKVGESFQVFEEDRVVGLAGERAHMFQRHVLRNTGEIVQMFAQERLNIEHRRPALRKVW
jgi:hypothetical protein